MYTQRVGSSFIWKGLTQIHSYYIYFIITFHLIAYIPNVALTLCVTNGSVSVC